MQGFSLRMVAVLGILGSLPLSASAADAASGVVTAIEKKYAVTETTSDFAQITRDGTTLEMKCVGVYSAPTSLLVKPENKVQDGKLQSPGSLTRILWTKSGAHILQTGDKVFVTKIESKPEGSGDSLRFTLLTVDYVDVAGSAEKKRYEALVSFRFKKGYLDETPPEQVEQEIETVLAPHVDEPPPVKEAATRPPAAPVPVQQAVAAPAPAPQGPPPTISIGESSTEVLQAMGMPQQMVDLGKKKTYIYKNMKIIFVNDKVSDVQ